MVFTTCILSASCNPKAQSNPPGSNPRHSPLPTGGNWCYPRGVCSALSPSLGMEGHRIVEVPGKSCSMDSPTFRQFITLKAGPDNWQNGPPGPSDEVDPCTRLRGIYGKLLLYASAVPARWRDYPVYKRVIKSYALSVRLGRSRRPAVHSGNSRRSFGQLPLCRRSVGQSPSFVRAVL